MHLRVRALLQLSVPPHDGGAQRHRYECGRGWTAHAQTRPHTPTSGKFDDSIAREAAINELVYSPFLTKEYANGYIGRSLRAPTLHKGSWDAMPKRPLLPPPIPAAKRGRPRKPKRLRSRGEESRPELTARLRKMTHRDGPLRGGIPIDLTGDVGPLVEQWWME